MKARQQGWNGALIACLSISSVVWAADDDARAPMPYLESDAALVVHWRFDETGGDQIRDHSRHGSTHLQATVPRRRGVPATVSWPP